VSLKILLTGLGIAASLLAVLGGGLVRGDGNPEPSGVGRPAPPFELASATGAAKLTASDLRGQPAVVNFWATWCPSCREEHATLQAAAREYQGRARFVGISTDDDAGAVKRFLDEHGAAYPMALDRQSQTASAFGATGVPQTYLLDASGTIVATVQGPVDGKALREVLEVLVEQAAAR